MKWMLCFLCFGTFSLANAATLPDFDSLWDYEHPAETQIKFLALLPEAEKSGDLEYLLQLQTQIARTDSLQRKFTEAHARLDTLEAKLKPSTPIAEVRYLLERGRAFNSSDRKSEALPLFLRAYKLGVKRKLDFFTVDAAHMIAIAENPESQLEWNRKAMKLAERSPDPRTKKWLPSLYNNIGWTHHDAGKFKLALESFRKVLPFFENGENASRYRIARWSVARALRSLKKYEEAFAIQRKLEKEFASIGEKDGYVFEELAELNLIEGKNTEAKKYFALAYEELAKDVNFAQTEAPRLARLKAESEK